MAHAHAREDAARKAVIAVIVVSDTRTLATDEGGRLLVQLATEAGHQVLSREVVPDDLDRIRDAVDRVLIAGSQVVILTGGTGVSPRDVTPEAVLPRLTRRIDGFGDLFRWLSFQEIGASAMLSRAFAGAVGTAAVFALPGSVAGCRLAMEKLILPDLGHLLAQLAKPPAWQAGPRAPAGRGAPDVEPQDEPTQMYRLAPRSDVRSEPDSEPPEATVIAPNKIRRSSTPRGATPRGATPRGGATRGGRPTYAPPDSTPPESTVIAPNKLRSGARVGMADPASAAPPPGDPPMWQQALESLGGTLDRDKWIDPPPSLERIAPVMDVLNRAGQRASVSLADGRQYGLWGFPDLQRPGSKVLAIRDANPVPEIVALHRWPFRSGTCVADRPIVAGLGEAPIDLAERMLGRPPPNGAGSVLAIDRGTVWILRGDRVFKWDGRKEADEGPLRPAIGRLILGWSER